MAISDNVKTLQILTEKEKLNNQTNSLPPGFLDHCLKGPTFGVDCNVITSMYYL